MKIYRVLHVICMLAGLCPCLKSQILSPDQWDPFISEHNTTLVRDTFRVQRFDGSFRNNWNYTLDGTYVIAPAFSPGGGGVNGAKILKMGLNTTLRFEKVSPSGHTSVKGGLGYVAQGLMIQENLNVILYHRDTVETVVLRNVTTDNFFTEWWYININRDLYGLDVQTSPAGANTKGGHYDIDIACLHGDIAQYSLFKGKGCWNDTVNWSHLPAERHRHGLVKGDVTIAADTHCDTVSLQGMLTVGDGVTLSLKQLFLYDETSCVKNEGSLLVDGCIELIRTFPEKGAWYFVSFPFDVYADGIDPAFALKDETPNAGGNYIYALLYDGKRRHEEWTNRVNWVVLPEAAASGTAPVFEKNKGYLLSIDKLADRDRLRFSSRKEEIPRTFGKRGELNIAVPSLKGEGDAHTGWHLCGNPLPSPLHVSELNHPALDDYVYFYNGENYTAIPVTENYLIPPYSAFFLKAEKSVTIELGAKEDENAILLSAPRLLPGELAEPVSPNSTGNNPVEAFAFCRFTQTSFCLENAPQKGTVSIVGAAGNLLHLYAFSAGESKQIPLPASSGYYILQVQMQNRRMEYKFVR